MSDTFDLDTDFFPRPTAQARPQFDFTVTLPVHLILAPQILSEHRHSLHKAQVMGACPFCDPQLERQRCGRLCTQVLGGLRQAASAVGGRVPGALLVNGAAVAAHCGAAQAAG